MKQKALRDKSQIKTRSNKLKQNLEFIRTQQDNSISVFFFMNLMTIIINTSLDNAELLDLEIYHFNKERLHLLKASHFNSAA